MNRVLTLVALVPFIGSVLAAQNTPGPAATQSIVGCVDVERCLTDYKKAKEQREQLKLEVDAKLRGLQEDRRKIDALKDQLDVYVRGSNEWLDLRKKIQLGTAQLQYDSEALELQSQRRLAELIGKLYEDIRREIKTVAQAKGMKLVLMYVSSTPKGQNDVEITNNIMVRPVLYYDPAADITSDVITRLNT